MSIITTAFWNLENLFDTSSSEIATDMEFVPDRGWTYEVLEAKLNNISNVIRSIGNNGPDLLGVCEIENENLARRLIDKIGRIDYSIASYQDSPDIRGIDTSLIYSKNIFEHIETRAYTINFRYPTRDIFYVKLRIKENNAELHVLVNHWPSRSGKRDGGDSSNTEFSRCMVAENCGRIVDNILKLPPREMVRIPDNIIDSPETISRLNERYSRNILIMGDFNDDPFDKSITKYLNATSNQCLLRDWKEILHLARKTERDRTDKQIYLGYSSVLFNCMWKFYCDNNINCNQYSNFSHYFGKNNTTNIFDQFIVSQGLLNGKQKLKINLDSVSFYNKSLTWGENLNPENFDRPEEIRPEKLLLIEKSRPLSFTYSKIIDKRTKMPFDNRKPNTGYSDHFPIYCEIETV